MINRALRISYALGAMATATCGQLLAQQGQPVATTEPAPRASCYQASHLIGCSIVNPKGERLGEILELVLDVANGRLAYAIVAFAGSTAANRRHFALPWRLLEIGRASPEDTPRATLDLDQATRRAAPGFDWGKWPDMADPAWAKNVDEYYRSHLVSPAIAPTAQTKDEGRDGNANTDNATTKQHGSKPLVHRRLSGVIGMVIVDPDGKKLGEVEDLVVNTTSASFDAAIASFIGLPDLEEAFVLVPTEAMDLGSAQNTFVVPCSEDAFRAMALPGGKLPPLDDDAWRLQALERFATESELHARALAEKTERARMRAAADALADVYDLESIERVTVTVLTVGSVWVGAAREERVRLRVRSADGVERIVHGAPIDFAIQAALELRAGRVIEVTGSNVRHGNQAVLIAGSIAVEGRTAQLRDAAGRVLWPPK